MEADFQDLHLDFADPVIRSRSWYWFRVRLEGLINRPFHLDPHGQPAYHSRIQQLVWGPLVRTDTRSEGAGP